jgi:arabinofuranosyltransferase
LPTRTVVTGDGADESGAGGADLVTHRDQPPLASVNAEISKTDVSDERERPIGRTRGPLFRALPRLLLVAPIVVVVVMAALRRWTSSNGFIYLRTVDQMLAGNGPVYNAGERVEAFMSPLWLAVLTIGDVLSPLRLEVTAAALSIACVAAAMLLATWASAQIARLDDLTGVVIPIGAAVFAALWPVWIWSTGAMETGIVCLWIALSFVTMTRWAVSSASEAGRLPVPTVTLVIAGLGWVVRPELALSSVIFVTVLVLSSTDSKRQRWTMVAISAAIPTIYQIFRMGFYGLIVPNPAVSRDALTPHPRQGWNYFINFVGPYGLLVPVLAIVIGIAAPLVQRLLSRGLTAAAVVTLAVSASGVVHAATLIFVGGDYFHARLLLPALFAFLAPFSVVPVRRISIVSLVVIGTWLPICAFVLRSDGRSASVLGTGYSKGALTHENHGYSGRGEGIAGLGGPGLYTFNPYTRSITPTGVETVDDSVVIAASGVGPIGYVAGPDVRIVDLAGGADPITAHNRADIDWFTGLTKVGHASWIVADVAELPETVLPGAIVAGNAFSPEPSGLEAVEDVAWARASLGCGQLGQLRSSYSAPITPGRFLHNLWNALPNSEWRFDDDPNAAYVEMCGSRTPDLVTESHDRVSTVDYLSESMASGDIAIIGRCDLVLMADEDDGWKPLEAATFTASIELDPDEPTAERMVLFELGPYDEAGSTTEVAVEVDGLGMFRVRSDTEFFPPSIRPWEAIAGEPIVVTFAPDLATGQWLVFVGLDGLVTLPMSSDVDAAQRAFTPNPVDSTSRNITVNHTRSDASGACSAHLPHTLD